MAPANAGKATAPTIPSFCFVRIALSPPSFGNPKSLQLWWRRQPLAVGTLLELFFYRSEQTRFVANRQFANAIPFGDGSCRSLLAIRWNRYPSVCTVATLNLAVDFPECSG